jgi:hypothetical protein
MKSSKIILILGLLICFLTFANLQKSKTNKAEKNTKKYIRFNIFLEKQQKKPK